jgi:hypothetical protein
MATEQPVAGKTRDLPGMVLAVLFIGVGAWVLLEARDLSALGSVFPRTIAVALILLSLLLIGQNLRRPRAVQAQSGPAGAGSTPRRLALVAVMAGWSVLLPAIGFFVSSIAAFIALLLIAEYERWTARRMIAYGAIALLVVAAFYVLLRDVLLIPLPRGLLF